MQSKEKAYLQQSIKKNEILAMIGCLCLIIVEMSTCISLVFYAHGL